MSLGPRIHEQDLGDILLAAHLLEESVLAQARRDAQRKNCPLWRQLTRENLVSEDALFKVLRQEVRMPVLTPDQLKSVVVPEELRAALPHEVAQRLGILPLERSTDGRRAVLAMVDPTSDITSILPALNKLGVAEVRRFLAHLGTLRLGLEFFYGRPWQPSLDDSILVPAEAPRSATTQPLGQSAKTGPLKTSSPSVVVDPKLQEELMQMDGPTDPRSTMHAERTAPLILPGAGLSDAGPAISPTLQSGNTLPLLGIKREPSMLEILPSDLMMIEESSLQIVRPSLTNEPSSRQLDKEPVQEALIKASELLLAELEAELHVTRPEALARLSQGVAERLGFAPSAVRELMLVSRLYGLLRSRLLRDGPLPAPRKDMLGFDVEQPLMKVLAELQAVLVDFIRLPSEPDLLPMGARIVEAATIALELYSEEHSLISEELTAKLRQRAGDNEVTAALLQVIETDLAALGIAPGQPEAAAGSKGPAEQARPDILAMPAIQEAATPDKAPPATPPMILLLAPLPPQMPDVSWQTMPIAALPEDCLQPYEFSELANYSPGFLPD